MLVRRELEDRKVQVRRIWRRVAGRADVTDDLPACDGRPFHQSGRIARQVRIVVGVGVGRVELVDGDAARLAQEQLRNRAVLDGDDWRLSSGHDVERFVLPTPSLLAVRITEVFSLQAQDWQREAALPQLLDVLAIWRSGHDDHADEETSGGGTRQREYHAPHGTAPHSVNSTLVPLPTIAARRSASQLVRRTQPCDVVWPTEPGSGVPWIP